MVQTVHALPSAVRFGLKSARLPVAEKPIVFSTDMDETLINWNESNGGFDELALMRHVRMMKAYAPKMAVHLNTGRGLDSIRLAVKKAAPFFAKMTLDYLTLNNGQDIYINKNRQRADRWIQGLTPSHPDRDRQWDRHLAVTTGWDKAAVTRTLEAAFLEHGFTEIQDPALQAAHYAGVRLFTKQVPGTDGPRTLLINWYGDQPSFSFSEVLDGKRRRGWTALCRKSVDPITRDILKALRASGMQVRLHSMEKGQGTQRHFSLFALSPKGIHKASPLKHLLENYQNKTRAVITAGDHEFNDAELLKVRFYKNAEGRRVPNYPIQSGHRAPLRKLLSGHPRVETAPQGELETSLETQVRKILDITA